MIEFLLTVRATWGVIVMASGSFESAYKGQGHSQAQVTEKSKDTGGSKMVCYLLSHHLGCGGIYCRRKEGRLMGCSSF